MTQPDEVPLSRDELFQLYQIAMEEYRFQVNLNWSRTQYFLTLNVGIFGIATGILQIASGNLGDVIAGLYFAGLVCCILSLCAAKVQKRYYESTRDHKARLEIALSLGPQAIKTTPGMGGAISRLGRVTTFLNALIIILGLMDLSGLFVAVFDR